MIIQVDQILKIEEYFLNEKIQIVDFPEGISEKDSAQFKAKITHGQTGELFIKGNISSTVNLKCVVCLEDFEENYNIDVTETYLPEGLFESLFHNEGGRLKELEVFFYRNNQIDTKKIVRDTLLANIPPYPICTKCSSAK